MTVQTKSTLISNIDTAGGGGTTGENVQEIAESAHINNVETFTITSPTVDTNNDYCRIDTTSNAVTPVLPALADAKSQQYTFKWVAGANPAIIDGNGAETIEGVATYTLATVLDAVILRPGPTEWEIVSEFLNA